jgi:pimeloyl-ACP methyl ester carboxylesterase
MRRSEKGALKRDLRSLGLLGITGIGLSLAVSFTAAGEHSTRATRALAEGGFDVESVRNRRIVSRPVIFEVRNTNSSTLPCGSDGAAYSVKGQLVGPARKLRSTRRARSVTFYLHEFSFGIWFWNFRPVRGLDYVRSQARAGHVSVIIDRLGYGESGHPDGNQVCLGSHADVAHQIVRKLRTGDYSVGGSSAPAFSRVALAGHSIGAQIAEIEAYSYRDVDALVVMSWATQFSERSRRDFFSTRVFCERGGEPRVPGGPRGYAFFGLLGPAGFKSLVFHSAKPSAIAAATAMRNRDPCGDSASLPGALVRDLASVREIEIPVLLVCGKNDAIIPTFACARHKRRYSGSSDVSQYVVPRAGHALTLERTAPTFRKRVSRWLRRHGF